MKHLIGQQILIGISGYNLTAEEKKFIIENNISGITLFARNLQSPEQIHSLCQEIQSLRHQMPDKAPLYIGIDMEGGRVHRLKSPFTQWPPLKKLGDLDSPTASFHFAYAMGLELRACGINLDYAPCVDVFTNPQNVIIGDRAISTDPEMVAKHASALIRGYIKAGIITCSKHFPGHGNTLIDSHEDLPIESADLKRLQETELVPFKKSFRSRVDMVMTAHISYPNIDKEWPVTLSKFFLKDLLRDDLRYRGLIITDDLDMKAMAKHYDKSKIPVLAMKAGADLLLYCNEPESPPIAMESLEKAIKDGELKKDDIEKIKIKVLAHKKEKLNNPDPISVNEMKKLIGSSEHFHLAQSISNGETPKGLAQITT